jgi:sulfatase maturation enzyme AslB (radical SAM superfamily)
MSQSMSGPPPPHGAAQDSPDWSIELAPFEKGKLKVILDISNKCNLRCRMCHFSFDEIYYRPAQHMRPEMFERVAESTMPLAHTVILSAANEPLMSPWFVEILEICARYRPPNLLFLTNAQRLNQKVADAIIRCGVTQVQISADGATKETYEYIRRGAKFEQLVENLKYLTRQKRLLGRTSPLLQFNLVLMQSNLEELPLFVDLAEEVGVEWIAARHLLVMKGLDMENESLVSDRARANHCFEKFFQRVDRSGTVTVIEFPDFFDGYQMTSAQTGTSEQPAGLPAAASKSAAVPFGYLDLPTENDACAANAIQFMGWALDDLAVTRISVEREPFPQEDSQMINGRGQIEIGDARILNGSRPDVAQAFPHHPHNCRAGWSFELRREMISQKETFTTAIHIVAHNKAGRFAEIGKRQVLFSANPFVAKPYLFCARPFDSLFVDAKGDVNPYPDCRPKKPFGSLTEEGRSIRDIWFGEEFRELRRRIVNRDPPPMCLTCAHFINRNVDDREYFVPR